MAQQINSFPMFFTLERVENGYILTAKEEVEGLTQEAKYRKEVVTNERIDERIGHLLCLDTLVKEHPAVFHVEAVGESTYKIDDMPDRENIMVAKLSFAHFMARKYPSESIIVLHIEDTNQIEVYGRDAELIAGSNNVALIRIGGIPMIRLPNSKEGLKTMASYARNPSVVKVSENKIMEWYYSHPVMQEKPPIPPVENNTKPSNKNNSPSNTSKQ